MQTIATQTVEIRDHKMRLLDIVYIFKGKVNAAANRPKISDCSDIEFLYARFQSYLRTHVHRINIQDAGKAIKRYPSLSTVFDNLGIDVHKAIGQAGSLEITSMHPPSFPLSKGLDGIADRLRWQSGGVPQAEQSTSAKGHLADRIFVSLPSSN
jgi:hypothetical protein